MNKLQNNRCSLCKVDEKSLEITNKAMGETNTDHDNLFKDSIDMDIEASLEKLRSSTAWDDFDEINLSHIPNLPDFDTLSDNFLDADLQLLKFDALKFSQTNS